MWSEERELPQITSFLVFSWFSMLLRASCKLQLGLSGLKLLLILFGKKRRWWDGISSNIFGTRIRSKTSEVPPRLWPQSSIIEAARKFNFSNTACFVFNWFSIFFIYYSVICCVILRFAALDDSSSISWPRARRVAQRRDVSGPAAPPTRCGLCLCRSTGRTRNCPVQRCEQTAKHFFYFPNQGYKKRLELSPR